MKLRYYWDMEQCKKMHSRELLELIQVLSITFWLFSVKNQKASLTHWEPTKIKMFSTNFMSYCFHTPSSTAHGWSILNFHIKINITERVSLVNDKLMIACLSMTLPESTANLLYWWLKNYRSLFYTLNLYIPSTYINI